VEFLRGRHPSKISWQTTKTCFQAEQQAMNQADKLIQNHLAAVKTSLHLAALEMT
jgi:hypothetical protein